MTSPSSITQAADLVRAAFELSRASDLSFDAALASLTSTAAALEADRIRFDARDTDVYVPPRDVYEALVNVAREVGPVRKDREAKAFDGGGSYRFRGIDGVMNAVHEAMARNGVLPVPHDDPNPGGDGTVPQVRDLEVTTRNGKPWRHHTITTRWVVLGPGGSRLEVPIVSEALDNQDKGLGKARSYGMKDLLIRMLTLPTDDPDADNEAARIPDADGQRYDAGGRPARRSSRRHGSAPSQAAPAATQGPTDAEVAAAQDDDARAAGFEDEAHRLACHNEVTALRRRIPDGPYREQVRTEHQDRYAKRWPLTAAELADFREYVETTLETVDADPTLPVGPAPAPDGIPAEPEFDIDPDVDGEQDGGS